MPRIKATAGERITFHAFTLEMDGALVDQPVGFPNLTLKRIDSDNTVTTLLDKAVMLEDVDGQYYYNWTAADGYANYKIVYEAMIEGSLSYGFDELAVRDPYDPVYAVHGYGDRYDIAVDQPILLQAQFIKNGAYTDPHQIVRVEIYNDYDEAQKDYGVGVPLETIESGDITPHGVITGRYGYNVSAQSLANLYFDKVYLIPEDGAPEMSFISPFYVRKTSVGYTMADREYCEVKFDVLNIMGGRSMENPIQIYLNREWAFYDKGQVRKDKDEEHMPDEDGVLIVKLLETDTMSTDTGKPCYYTIQIGRWRRKFRIPKGALSADLMDLPTDVG